MIRAGFAERPARADRRRYGYTLSLLFFFVLPFLALGRRLLRSVDLRPFAAATAVVSVLGWGWSMLLSKKGWWTFHERHITGLRVLPHVPLEEFVIYPIGGAFSIFFYHLFKRPDGDEGGGGLVRGFVSGVTAAFALLAAAHMKKRPFYLYSQLGLFNGLCAALAPAVLSRLDARGVAGSVGILGAIGFTWDYLAFRFGWWSYRAITGVRVKGIPVEDVNFYLMAPTAAISIYLALRHRLRKTDSISAV